MSEVAALCVPPTHAVVHAIITVHAVAIVQDVDVNMGPTIYLPGTHTEVRQRLQPMR